MRFIHSSRYTAQGFEVLSGALTGAVSGFWKIKDADQGKGVLGFTAKDGLWQTRRRLAKGFWVD
ncbi:MAG: hypothetical protein ACTSQ1_13300 [Promethearchaeota archaeon]